MVKLKIWDEKRVGGVISKIWYLKFKISEALEIKLEKKCKNNFPTHNQLAKIVKGG